jgi:hypothetical protein
LKNKKDREKKKHRDSRSSSREDKKHSTKHKKKDKKKERSKSRSRSRSSPRTGQKETDNEKNILAPKLDGDRKEEDRKKEPEKSDLGRKPSNAPEQDSKKEAKLPTSTHITEPKSETNGPGNEQEEELDEEEMMKKLFGFAEFDSSKVILNILCN